MQAGQNPATYLPQLQSRQGPRSPALYQGQYGYSTSSPRYGPAQPIPSPQQLPGYQQIARSTHWTHRGEEMEVESDNRETQHHASQHAPSLPTPAYATAGGRPTYTQTHWNPNMQQHPAQFHHHSLPGVLSSPEQYDTTQEHFLHRSDSHERVVGKDGFPDKIESKGPKSRFTADEDRLLRQLKEREPKLSWKQIADFFPQRRSGTLQVRYCTKLKAKPNVVWSDNLMADVKRALEEDRRNAYHRVALKMGKGLTADAIQKRIEDDQDEKEALRLREQQPEDYEEATEDAIDESSSSYSSSRRDWGPG